MLPEADLYRRMFILAHRCSGDTWAKKSLTLLEQWNVPDWPEWEGAGRVFTSYTAHVMEVLSRHHSEAWRAAVKKHCVPVQYLRIVLCFSNALKWGLQPDRAWGVLLGQRYMVRLRCGLVPLGHRHLKLSPASTQCCIFCDVETSAVWAHVFGACPQWSSLRSHALCAMGLAQDSRQWDTMYSVLASCPDAPGYEQCISFVSAVVVAADTFWQDKL